jgi:hypothetical protein
MDDMQRATTIVYSLTPRALEWFRMRVGPSKMGDVKHARMIEKLLKEQYWPMGYYCIVDWGESSAEMPDIAVLEPRPKTIKDKFGNDQTIKNPFIWDNTTATAVEIEMSPLKNKQQVLRNYNKNKTSYKRIRFVVTSQVHAQQLLQILNEDPPADPNKYFIDIIEFESLNEVTPGVQASEEEEAKKFRTPEKPQEKQIGDTEEAILDYILAHGFTSREEISQSCTGRGMEMSVRSVSRCLKALTDKGLLQRQGKEYLPTELARNRERQETL